MKDYVFKVRLQLKGRGINRVEIVLMEPEAQLAGLISVRETADDSQLSQTII